MQVEDEHLQVEDECCSIMLMSIYAVQSLASVAGRQAEDGKSRENDKEEEKRCIKGGRVKVDEGRGTVCSNTVPF